MKQDPKALYKAIILRHNKAPIRYEKVEDAQYHLDAYNPICGDRFSLYFDLEQDKIRQIHFHGYGCTISKASTSVLVENLQGKTLEEARALVRSFLGLIYPPEKSEAIPDVSEDFAAFAPARDFPGRDKCASLSWEEMEEFLNQPHS